jgi:hypothetical protein
VADVLNVTLVSKRLHSFAIDTMYSCLDLAFTPLRLDANLRLFQKIADNPELHGKVGTIVIMTLTNTKKNQKKGLFEAQASQQLQALQVLLPALHRLRIFRYVFECPSR